MKKFIITVSVLLCLFLAFQWFDYRYGLNWQTSERPAEIIAKTAGRQILIRESEGYEPFEIRGVDLGAGIPGYFATDYKVDKETYLRWFDLIQQMGANTIRVYTILNSDFYNAFYEYNQGREEPLYLIHGLWVNDYVQFSHRDAYDQAFLGTFLEDARTLINILHGRQMFSLGYGTGSGSYHHDVSPWVIGYILGVEWEPTTVAFTNQRYPDMAYHGEYFSTTPEANAFKAMLAQVGDTLARYEDQRFHCQKMIAFSNWPTTDPFDYPDLMKKMFEKFASVNVEHIAVQPAFQAGQFASYHVYPYFPDYLGVMNRYEIGDAMDITDQRGEQNSYYAYLKQLADYHTMPVVIAEFGVPSSRGQAKKESRSRSQGGLNETEQAEALVSCYEDIMASGCAGSIVFSWQDEWFKRTWNTMAHVDLTKTPFWSDVQTNEQFFGLLAFDPGKERSVSYPDGDLEEWQDMEPVLEADALRLYAQYDEKYLYLMIEGENYNPVADRLSLGLDITPKSGSSTVLGTALNFDQPIDFYLMIRGDQAEIQVQERYEVLNAVSGSLVYGEDPFLDPPAKDSPVFKPIQLILQDVSRYQLGLSKVREMPATDPTGILKRGNGNPEAADFNSLTDYCFAEHAVELRLPWELLNFSNPSEMQIHDDYYEKYGVENLTISSIQIGATTKYQGEVAMGRIPLKGWGRKVTCHERLKEAYWRMQQVWASK